MAKSDKKEDKKEGKKKFIDLSKWHIKTILAAIGLIVLIILFLLFLKLTFLVDEKLRMTISPEYTETTVVSPGILSIQTDVKIYNKFLCEAKCDYVLIDLSSNNMLDNGTFNAKAFKNEKYSKDIILDSKGYGTNLYLYRIECSNEYKTLCPAVDDKLVRKSLFVVSYTPDDVQLSALDYSKDKYSQSVNNYVEASKLVVGTGKIISSLNLPINTQEYYYIDSDLSVLQDDFNNIVNVWDTQDLIKTKSLIDTKNIVSRSNSILERSKSYNNLVIDTATSHNVLIDNLTSLRYKMLVYEKLNIIDAQLSELNLSPNNLSNNFVNSLSNSISEYNIIADNVANEYNYTFVKNSYDSLVLKTSVNDLNNINSVSATLKNIYPMLYVQSKILCQVDNSKCLGKDYSNYIISTNSNSNIESYNKLIELCIDSIHINNNTLFNDSNSSESLESLMLQYDLMVEYYSLTQNSESLYYINNISNNLLALYNVTSPESYIITLNASTIYFNNFNTIYSGINLLSNECSNIDLSKTATDNSLNMKNVKSQNYNISILDDVNIYNVDISTRGIPDFIPQCCIYDKCQSCDKSLDSDNVPLIMLHGHSFVQDTHAYSSVEIFNSFEKQFTEDKLYFPSGILLESDKSTSKILGKYKIPVMSKPTYYLQTYNDLLGLSVSESKTGNIDSYALRLKEQIDYTKYITGVSKVNIVAHSMGGLVVRRYIQIFGSEDVNKIILIGSPNNGITERTYTFCKIFGETNECDDMRSGGLFLKKLNGEQNSLDMSKTYLVIGRGCDTDGLDGDGVVVANNSIIKGIANNHILYIEGKCSGSRVLHNDMLDNNLYPEVYYFVKDKLSD